MVDYKKVIGTNPNPGYQGYMMIRDSDPEVSVWVIAGSTNTSSYQTPYWVTINGSKRSGHFNYPEGGRWLKLNSWNVTDSQTVTFQLGDSNTEGLGNGATLSHYIDRGTKPPAPGPFKISSYDWNSANGDLDSNGDGGLPVDTWQVGYGQSSTNQDANLKNASDTGYASITGLSKGTSYYFWARGHNAKGWSNWSSRTSIRTWDVPDAPTGFDITSKTDTSATGNSNQNSNNGDAVDQWQIGYGTSSSSPQSYQNVSLANGVGTITGLTKGTRYYFWARCHNSVGWSGWSGRTWTDTWDVPDAPNAVALSDPSQTTVKAVFSGNGNGGTGITSWRIGYGTSSSSPQMYKDGYNETISGLDAGTTYYFWAQGQNSVGWSPLSPRRDIQTIAGARVKVGTVWKEAVPFVNDNGTWKLAQPWVRIGGQWKETT